MIILYPLIMLAIVFSCLALRKYELSLRKTLSKKEHPLLVLYGLCFFLSDVFSLIKGRFHKTQTKPEAAAEKSLRLLHPDFSSNSKVLLKAYHAKLLSYCIAGIFLASALGFLYTVNVSLASETAVLYLDRPTDSDSADYYLIADTSGTKVPVQVSVGKKTYTAEEALQLFDDYKDEILKTMLAKNPDAEHVSSSLYFPASIGDENISLGFTPEDLSLISSNGEIVTEEYGVVTSIFAEMELDGFTAGYSISITLTEPTYSQSELLENSIAEFLEDSDTTEPTVALPDTLDDNPISFSYEAEQLDWLFVVFLIIIPFLMPYIYKNGLKKKVTERNKQMMTDYPELVSKLMLLTNAGLSPRHALTKIAADYKQGKSGRYAYEELCITVNAINTGESEAIAYQNFGRRCGLLSYIKLGAILSQNISSGTSGTLKLLTGEARTALENHKAEVISDSKTAETKMLLPMIIMLIIIMALIMVPSFMNM